MFASDARDEGTTPSNISHTGEGPQPVTVDELTYRYQLAQLAPSSGLISPLFTRTLPLPNERDVQEELSAFLHGHRWTFVSIAVHAVMLTCFALMPPTSSALAIDLMNEDARYMRYLATPIVRDDDPIELPSLGPSGGAAGAANKGEAGQIGETRAPNQRTRGGLGTKGAPTQNVRAEAAQAGILGVLANSSLQNMQDLSAFETSDNFGYANDPALGLVLGDQLGSNAGFGGLTMRGTGRSGGGDVAGSVGVGRLGTGLGHGPGGGAGSGTGFAATLGGMKREGRVPTIRCGRGEGTSGCGAEVRGSMSKEAIRRVIQRHMNEVRFCYEEGLRKQPDLAGRVQVSFMISPTGVVTSATVGDSSLHNGQVEGCIAQAARRWTFPAPDGGGYVAVRYPFLLEQAGQ